ncbi:MAG TPA: SpoIIE family protein phosphatase [Chloroflexia bacterium]|nr:SpoIIE family protein phosphatase [Chloroflexia bacterium]
MDIPRPSPRQTLRHLVAGAGILVTFLLLLTALVNTAGGIGQPWGGFTLSSSYAVNENPAPGAVRLSGPEAGDRIVLMDGQSPRELGAVFARAAAAGQPVQYVVLRRPPGGGPLAPARMSGGTTIFHLRQWVDNYGAGLLLSLVWWALGSFVYLVGADRLVHQVFLAASLCVSNVILADVSAGTYSYQVTPLGPTFFAPLYSLLLPLTGATLLHLSASFPLPKPVVMRRPAWLAAPYLLALACGVPNVLYAYRHTQPLLVTATTTGDPIGALVSSGSLLYVVIATLVFMGGLAYDWRRAPDAVVRRQVRLVVTGVLIGALPQVLGELLPLALRLPPLITGSQGYLFLTVPPVLLAYAIVRYRLFDVSRVLQLGAAYVAASSVLLGLYFLLVSALQAILREVTGEGSETVALVSTLGIAVLFAPLITRAQQGAERLLFRERFLLQQALRAFGARVATIYDLDALAEALVDETQGLLQVRGAALYLAQRDESGWRLQLARERGASLTALPPMLGVPAMVGQGLIGRPGAVDLEGPADGPGGRDPWPALRANGVELVLPLVAGGDLVGVLLLGRKLGRIGFLREEVDVLEAIAGQAALALRNAQLLVARAEQERLRSELEVARTIQRRLLPARVPQLPGLEIAAECLPAMETSGDSYDLLADERGTLHVVLSDACGKSVPAAMLIALSRNTLRSALTRTADPAQALTETNAILTPDLSRGQFLAVTCLSIDPAPRQVRLANAGQMYPLLARRGRDGAPATCEFIEPPPPRLPLGLIGSLTYGEICVPLEAGDLLVCYSDGLVDVAKQDGEQLGFDRLADLVCGAVRDGLDAPATLALLVGAAGNWGDRDTPRDDITLVVVRVLAPD